MHGLLFFFHGIEKKRVAQKSRVAGRAAMKNKTLSLSFLRARTHVFKKELSLSPWAFAPTSNKFNAKKRRALRAGAAG